MRLRLVVVGILLATSACGNPTAPVVSKVPNDALLLAAVDFDEALNALRFFSGYDDRARLVIRDHATWSRVWRRAAGTSSSHSLPHVDFDRHVIIFAAMGTRTSTGYLIEIEQLFRRGDDIYAVVNQTSPGPACGTGDAITAPITAALAPRIGGRVYFVERTTVNRCSQGRE